MLIYTCDSRAILPSTNKVYELYTRQTRTPAQSVTLDHGAHGHWIGDKNADNVIVWFHGGGFSLPANIGYFQFFARIIADMKAAGKSVAVFSLSYTLAQHGPYPTQLRQAVECLRYVLEETEHKPGRVFLGGDSAGGNLVGGVLSHLSHPHPQIEPLALSGNLAGAVMIAPWTLLDAEFPDRVIYNGGDLITESVAGPWAAAYIAGGKRDHYTDLSTAPDDWYRDFPVQKVLITGGENEILLPVIEQFAEKFKVSTDSSTLKIAYLLTLFVGLFPARVRTICRQKGVPCCANLPPATA